MKYENEMQLEIKSKSENESFARTVITAFVAQLDPTLEEISDLKTAVSEAVTNCIIHAYASEEGKILLYCKIEGSLVTIKITDYGIGIKDVEKAMQPLYTTKPEWERSGMGFAFMQAFMDEVMVQSAPGEGTSVIMKKKIQSAQK